MNEEEKKELEKSVDETVEEMKRKIEEITKAAEDVEDEGVSSGHQDAESAGDREGDHRDLDGYGEDPYCRTRLLRRPERRGYGLHG